MNVEILLSKDDSIELKSYLSARGFDDFEIIDRSGMEGLRSLVPIETVAVIAATGATLNVALKGLIDLAIANRNKRIVIQSKNGARVEFPAEYSGKTIDEIIKKIDALDANKIILK